MDRHTAVLKRLANELNEANITWGLGGSFLLYYNNYDVKVHDIDLIVDLKDYDKLVAYLSRYEYIYKDKNDLYNTRHFFSLVIDQIDIDIMIDFRVVTDNELYVFPFNESLIERKIHIDSILINLCSLDEWLKAYEAMGRVDKVKLIESKLNKK